MTTAIHPLYEELRKRVAEEVDLLVEEAREVILLDRILMVQLL